MKVDDLLLLAQVHKAGSLSEASRQLDLPKATLSRRLTALETAVGARLFVPGASRLTLTELGEQLAERAARHDDDIAETRQWLASRESTPRGRLRVSVPAEFAMLRSNGCLGTHLDPGGTFKVQRWMSIYGEYRKQYRIATMMLRPLRLHEIARKADAKMTEVFDVVNAYDAIGLLEWEPRKSRYAEAERRTPVPGKRRLLAAALLAR